MNAAVVQSFDAPPVYTSFADPKPGEDELAVQVKAAGLHQLVRALARGKHYSSSAKLPFIPGVDGAGQLDDGMRVYFLASRSPFGSFAERTITTRSLCVPMPAGIDDISIAGLGNPAMSSWVALSVRARLIKGESVLILGATGTSGKLAIQIAKRLGAGRVIAAGRGAPPLDDLRAVGADETVSLDQEQRSLISSYRDLWKSSSVDIVLDYLWGAPAEFLLEAIAQKGSQKKAPRIRYVQIGSVAGATVTLAGSILRSSGLELLGSGFGSASSDEVLKSIGQFFQEAARKPFSSNLAAAPLKDVHDVWTRPELGSRFVLIP
jgi:NADPH2:quinone reductase